MGISRRQGTEISTASFRGLTAASPDESERKRAVSSQDTRPELRLRRELWHRGLRFRCNAPHLTGKPDITFARAKVAVFCDGDFWHGRGWEDRRHRLSRGHNASYWIRKIETNIERDCRVNEGLKNLGWTVVRIWESEILGDVQAAADRVEDVVRANH